MSLQASTAVRNAMLDAIETAIGTSAKLEIFSGAVPANVTASEAGVKIVEFDLASDWAANASGGSKSFNNAPLSVAAALGGVAGHYRIFASDGVTCHLQGIASQSGAAWLATTAYVVNQVATNGGNVYKATTAGTSAGSVGPTGTGGSIADGTVVWAYQGPVGELTLDNTNIAAGQTVNVTSFSIAASMA